MPNQEYITEPNEPVIVPVNRLNTGELGEIVNSNSYDGLIVAKILNGFVCVYSPKTSSPAFQTMWGHDANFRVRRLNPNEVIKLHN